MTITYLAPDGVEITAQQFRQAQAATHGGGSGRRLGGRSGFRVDTPSNVLTATSTTWTLGPCAAMIDPGATTHQGMYGWSTDANATGSVNAADDTYARKDIVYIQVNDSSSGDGSGALTANVSYLAGPEDGTNAPPALPVRSFLVGTISVPIAGGGSPTVVLNPARYAAAGAPLPVYSATERDALDEYDGLTVQRRDLPGRPLETYDGAAWFRDEAISWSTLGAWTTPNGTISRRWSGSKWEVNFIGHLVLSTDAPFTLTTAMAVIGTAVPAGWTPAPGTAYGTGAYSNNTPTYQGPIVARVDTSGVLSVAAVTGTLGVVQNCQFFIDISWTY